jgi:dTDP-4-amino-4,6-dideoxy-D-galactose acyltransferase
MAAQEACTFLEWDSGFFGRRIARVNQARLDAERMAAVEHWRQAHAIDCLYLLVDAADLQAIRCAEQWSFRCTDLRVTLVCRLADAQAKVEGSDAAHVRPAAPDDLPALQAIARVSHRDSRFYADPHFERERCDALYETWITNSCAGQAEQVLVAERAGRAAGYISCHCGGAAGGSIGLIAVCPDARGLGLGRVLLGAALDWFRDQAREADGQVTVVTQGRNVRAQRLYQRCGFVSEALQLWYHRWYVSEQGTWPGERACSE